MDVMIETFPNDQSRAKRKASLNGAWTVAAEGPIDAGDDLLLRNWSVAGANPAQTLTTTNKLFAVFTSK